MKNAAAANALTSSTTLFLASVIRYPSDIMLFLKQQFN